ncbi:hypothetical protein LXL04_012447 [Taraxacum kok-saghyz]
MAPPAGHHFGPLTKSKPTASYENPGQLGWDRTPDLPKEANVDIHLIWKVIMAKLRMFMLVLVKSASTLRHFINTIKLASHVHNPAWHDCGMAKLRMFMLILVTFLIFCADRVRKTSKYVLTRVKNIAQIMRHQENALKQIRAIRFQIAHSLDIDFFDSLNIGNPVRNVGNSSHTISITTTTSIETLLQLKSILQIPQNITH